MGMDFTSDQKNWLDGFASGLGAMRAIGRAPASVVSEPTGPDAEQTKAQDRQVAEGKKLADQEKWKRAEHPFESYDRLKAIALTGARPNPQDNFRWRYHGLFYVGPAQDSYMCRMRVHNGILKHWQFAAIADLADRDGGGYAHVTTRCNLQVREIQPERGSHFLEGLADVGIIPRGAGSDNIRNVTGSATAGIDPNELLDTRPHAKDWHHHILNTRVMYNLPRKFNVAFDGCGNIATLEDTNDIGFQAVEVMEGAPIAAGVYYRLAIGGISGHKDLARDTGVVLPPGDCIKIADAIIRVWSEHGDRTNRNHSRMKYVLDAWGFEKFLAAVEEKLGEPLTRLDAVHVAPRPGYDRLGHIGVHRQRQEGLNYVGVVLEAGRLSTDQMRSIAEISRRHGDGDVRLTVWQNFILSGVKDADVETVRAAVKAIGLDTEASTIRAGLVACTGSFGCKFANADTKRNGNEIVSFIEPRVAMDQPINMHLTGCPNSCAQHYIGDIGLIGVKVPIGDDDTVPGYNIHVGGGFGTEASIAKMIYPDTKAEDAPARVEGLLKAYLAHRAEPTESFHSFANRHEVEALKSLAQSHIGEGVPA